MCVAYRGFPVATDFLKQPPTEMNDSACGCVLSSPLSPQGPSPLNCLLSLLQFSIAWSPKFKPTSLPPLHLSPLCPVAFPFTPACHCLLLCLLCMLGKWLDPEGISEQAICSPEAPDCPWGAQLSTQQDPWPVPASQSLHGGKTLPSA